MTWPFIFIVLGVLLCVVIIGPGIASALAIATFGERANFAINGGRNYSGFRAQRRCKTRWPRRRRKCAASAAAERHCGKRDKNYERAMANQLKCQSHSGLSFWHLAIGGGPSQTQPPRPLTSGERSRSHRRLTR